MKKISEIRRPKLATVLAALALCVVLGGTATAASGLINGKNIKRGTITGKQIKNKTLNQAKFAPATLEALKGAQGPRGEKGETGAKGDTGIPGVAGPEVVTTYHVDDSSGSIPANTTEEVTAFNNLPASKYLVIAKAVIFANTGGNMSRCSIETNNNGGGDEAQWTSPGNSSRTTVPMVLSTSTKVTHITFDCDPGNGAGSFTVDAVAVPIG